jgi:fumarate reductase flavoprotein subunit
MQNGVLKGVGCIIQPGTRLPKLGDALESATSRGNGKVSRSWEDIATWIETEPKRLRATIDEYNSSCDRGQDEIFAKDRRYLWSLLTPPFYALKCYPRFLGTIGGIKINHHMEVLDAEDNPIPGLYAAGVDTGGWEADTYNAILSGSTFGFAVNSGRIAGENAMTFVGQRNL